MAIMTLVRHGQASFGTGNYDRLTPLGAAQASQTGKHFASQSTKFGQVLIGPLKRQRQTAEGILGQLDASHEVRLVPALTEFAEPEQILAAAEREREMGAGGGAGGIYGLPHAEQLRRYGKTIMAWASGNVALDGAASCDGFVKTVADWFDEVVNRAQPARRTLVVTSGGVIAACMVHHFGLPTRCVAELAAVLGNCSVTEFVFSKGRCSLLRFNSASHLSGELTSEI